MTDKLLQAMFIAAAIVIIGGGLARADDYEPGYDTTGHYETNAYGREYVPPTTLPNPDPAYSQPPIATVLQNQEFINQSYRR